MPKNYAKSTFIQTKCCTCDFNHDFGDTTLNKSEDIEYYSLFLVLHFADGPCALISQPAGHRGQCYLSNSL